MPRCAGYADQSNRPNVKLLHCCRQRSGSLAPLLTDCPQVVASRDSSVGTGPSSVTISRCADHTSLMACSKQAHTLNKPASMQTRRIVAVIDWETCFP
jgi:hypothetical protein